MSIRTDTEISRAAASLQTADTLLKSSTADFQTVYNAKVQELWDNYQKTGMTAADQELKTIGGEEALKFKRELEKKKKASQKQRPVTTEIIKKHMPDGSVLVITTKNGRVTDQYRKKPQLVWVPDPLQTSEKNPLEAASDIKMKQVPQHRVFDD